MRTARWLALLIVVTLALFAAPAARADEGMLPPALGASRFEEILDRAGYTTLPIETRRVLRDLHAEYVVAYATIRDSRTEEWLRDVDALFTLSKAPNETEVRRLLREHGALVERAAALDRELFAKVAAVLPSADAFDPPADLTIAAGLREVDRMASSMPFQAATGVRGDLHAMVSHLDIPADRRAAVTAIVADRDRALPGRVREVWLSARQLLVAAAKGFDDVFGGVLPKLGAAIDENEARRKRDEIVARCREDIERCLKARRHLREADDRAIDAILALLPASERRELLIRVSFRADPSRVMVTNTEAAYRAALRLVPAGDLHVAIEAALSNWTTALERAVRSRLKARDLDDDKSLANGSHLGRLVIDFSEFADLPGDTTLAAATESARELGALLEPMEEDLKGSGLQLIRDVPPDEDRRPRASSRAWGSLFAAFVKRASDAQSARGDPRIAMSDGAGVAPWWDPRFVDAAVLDALAPERRDAARAIVADAGDEYARRVRLPVARAKETIVVKGDLEARRRSALDAVRLRNDAFFACEAIDRECFSSLQAIVGAEAEAEALERAAYERAFDRELPSIDLLGCAIANPFTALRDAELGPETRMRVARAMREAMRTLMPDVRRARAASFAVAEHFDTLVFDGLLPPTEAYGEAFRERVAARFQADRTLEKSLSRFLAALAEAAGDERAALERAYAALAMREDDDRGSAAVSRALARVGRLGLDEARTVEIASLAKAHAEERAALVLERAIVDSGWRQVRSRYDEVSRFSQLIEACDDRLVAGIVAILTPAERAAVIGGDSLDRTLDGIPDEDAATVQ